jgi:hypothetical protein
MRRISVLSITAVLVVTIFSSTFGAGMVGAQQGPSRSIQVQVTAWGPDQTKVDDVKRDLMSNAILKSRVKGPRTRILSFELVDDENKDGPSEPPSRYRAVVYDYTANKAFAIEGRFDSNNINIVQLTKQPSIFNEEEFNEAVGIITADRTFGNLIKNSKVQAFTPMPEVQEDAPERTLLVGLRAPGGSPAPEIVGVNMVRKTLVRYGGKPPRGSLAAPTACGPSSAGQGTTGRGSAGQFEVVVTQGPTEVWRFLAIRPSSSSGTRGSGVELRDVRYKGKMVLKRGHAPILNVKYNADACGPFRDWQWQEGMLTASGTSPAPGFRLCQAPDCTTPPQTILDSGTDSGNFLGVAAYVSESETILVSEMQAGWYRYVTEWRFNADGTILPRFGFGGVNNSCVCNPHNHHVYWRLDFDIETSGNNVVFGPGLRFWPFPISSELKIIRNPSVDNTLNVQNRSTGATYSVIPGDGDGIADTYGRGDVWILRFNSAQLDDGHNSTGSQTEADLDQFVNGEAVDNHDIVMWYRASFLHVESESVSPHASAIHVVGPTLKMVTGY